MNIMLTFKQKISITILLTIISGLTLGVGILIGAHNTNLSVEGVDNMDLGKPEGVDFSVFWDVWSMIDQNHIGVEKTDPQERVWSAVQGMLMSLDDPNTVFFKPKEALEFKESLSGKFEGVGMEVGIRNGMITVISPLKNSPAYRAGVKSRDIVVEIDGESTSQMSLNEGVSKIRGEKGSEVVLTVIREGADATIEITIVRDVIDVPTVGSELRSDGIFVISIYNFTGDVVRLFRSAVNDFKISGSDKLIIDIRGNAGGFLEAAIEITSYFLPDGEIVVQEEYVDESRNKVRRSRGNSLSDKNISIVVLIDGGSASASEILAAALRDHGVATLVGSTSFGKGSIQDVMTVTKRPETVLKVTIAKWITPSGDVFDGVGIEPDIEVERSLEDFENDRDPQLDKAVEVLLSL